MSDSRGGDPVDILLVEDNPGDVRLTQEAFRQASIANDLDVVCDGEAALDYLHQRGEYADAPVPSLILLDLNLPKLDGMDVLETIKDEPDLRRIPVVVLTGSGAKEDVVESYEKHTNAYLTKPIDPDEFIDLVTSFEDFWFRLVELPPTSDQ